VLTLSDVVRRRPEVTLRVTPTGALLIDLGTGRCWQLNRLGADFLSQVETERSLSEVCTAVGARYDAPLEVIERDLLKLAQELSDSGLIERIRG
jgi:hypothetical protein